MDAALLQDLKREIEKCSREYDDYKVTYTLSDTKDIDKCNVDGSLCMKVYADVVIERSNGERYETSCLMLNIPIRESEGYLLNGSRVNIVNKETKASGFAFNPPDKKATKAPKFDSWVDAVPTGNMNNAKFSWKFQLGRDDKNLVIVLNGKSIHLGRFLRAITGETYKDILKKFGFNHKYLISTLKNEVSRDICIEDVARTLGVKGQTTSDKFEEIMGLFRAENIAFDEDDFRKLDTDASFMNRVVGTQLAADVKVYDDTVGAEIVLEKTTDITVWHAAMLDHSKIDALPVMKGGKKFTLRKFYHPTFTCAGKKLEEPVGKFDEGHILSVRDLQELEASGVGSVLVRESSGRKKEYRRFLGVSELTIEHLYQAISILLDNLEGFQMYDSAYDLKSQKVLSIEKESVNKVITNLGVLTRNIEKKLTAVQSKDDTMLESLSGAFGGWDVNAILVGLRGFDKRNVQQFQKMNVLASAASTAKVAKNVKRSTAAMVDVKDDQHCRVDPIDSPESEKIGQVGNKTFLVKENLGGDLLAPYYRVVDGKADKSEVVYITALQENGKYIAQWNETFEEELDGQLVPKKKIECRKDGTLLYTDIQNVNYMEVSPFADMSAARMQLPLQQNALPKRLLMAGNHQKQADKPLGAQKAFVRSGGDSIVQWDVVKAKDLLEYYYANYANKSSLDKEHLVRNGSLKLNSMTDGESERKYDFLISCDGSTVGVLTMAYPFITKAEEHTQVSYLVNSNTGLTYSGDDIVVYPDSYTLSKHNLDMKFHDEFFKEEDINFDLAVSTGVNLFVGYKTWESSSIDDALSISSRLVGDDTYTTINLHEIKLEGVQVEGNVSVFRNTDRLPYMEENGLPKLGTQLRPGDVAITMEAPKLKGNVVTGVVRRAVVDSTLSGQVVSTYIKDNTAYVYLADWQPIMVGDKMAGRCGNKGVVAKIVPHHLMPFDPVSGRTLDIVLNPLGVPSRGNISQILETVLGMATANQGKLCVITPYYENTTEIIKEAAELYDAKPRVLMDGRTGKPFYRPLTVGYIYMLILHHKVSHKLNAAGTINERSPGTNQPVKGKKRGGGQTIGEMEFHCLMSYGAHTIMQELLTLQSEDEESYKRYLNIVDADPFAVYEERGYEDVKSTKNLDLTNHNDQFLRGFLRSLCVEVVTDKETGSIEYVPMTSKMIRSCGKPVNVAQKDSIRQASIFMDRTRDSKDLWGYIPLGCEIIHPIWLEKGNLFKYFIANTYGVSNYLKQPLHKKVVKNIIDGRECILYKTVHEHTLDKTKHDFADGAPTIYVVNNSEMVVEQFKSKAVDADWDGPYSGVGALAELFKRFSMNTLVSRYEEYLDGLTEVKAKDLSIYHDMCQQRDSGREMHDYVIDAYPVMPLDYRFDPKIARKKPDFDVYYENICSAVLGYSKTKNISSHCDIYNAIHDFFTTTGSNNHDLGKYINLSGYYLGHRVDKSKGHIRDGIMKRVVSHSGRSTITPTSDVTMQVNEVGLPIMMVVQKWKPHLISYMKYIRNNGGYPEIDSSQQKINWGLILDLVATRNKNRLMKELGCVGTDFSTLHTNLFNDIVDYIEGNPCRCNGHPNVRKVVLFGRQPSLHKLSLRAYYVKIVTGLSINIHPLVCDAYNADFDGDQMWVVAMLTHASLKEATELMMADSTLINPKDSSLALVHTQDIRLGCYFATMLHDNIVNAAMDSRYVADGQVNFVVYNDIETLKYHVETGNFHVHNLVRLNTVVNGQPSSYVSTAGRILFNSIFPDGFTRKAWTNPLGLPIGGSSRGIYELKYDGIISGKNRTNPVSFKLADIMQELYTEDANKGEILRLYQEVMEFGFFYSDKSAISYTLQDLENPDKPATDRILEISKKYQRMIDDDYNSGLITDEGRKMANISLYQYATDTYRDAYIAALDRNNNIFIMLDSNARGNAGQLMMASGIIGILDKQKDQTLELPILSNYKDGVSNFEMKMISYSARTGVASTQNETAEAGELTRSAVYLNSGLRIVAEDCHREEVDPNYILYTLTYGDAKNEVYKNIGDDLNYLLGMTDVTVQGDDMFTGLNEIDENFLALFPLVQRDIFIRGKLNGRATNLVVFYKPELLLGSTKICEIISIDEIEGTLVEDTVKELLYGALTKEELGKDDFEITYRLATQMQKQHVHYFETDKGAYRFSYSLCGRDRDLLLYRYCTDDELPYLMKGNYISSKTIEFIERYGLTQVDIRTMLDCQCKDGVCAKCYGLKFDSMELPRVGENVCIESAQAMGEPATQIKLSKFHGGGAAGAGVSGVDNVKNALIWGSSGEEYSETKMRKVYDKVLAVQAPVNGYVYFKKHDTYDQKIIVYLLPGNVYKEVILGHTQDLYGYFNVAVDKDSLLVAQGQYIRRFDPLTSGDVLPTEDIQCENGWTDDIATKKTRASFREIFRARQLQTLDFYYNIYHENGVDVHARHFEVTAVLQTGLVFIQDSSNPAFKVGGVYEYKRVKDEDNVVFSHAMRKSAEVIGYFSGPATLLSYRDVSRAVSNVVSACAKDTPNNAILGKMIVGTNIATNDVKANPDSFDIVYVEQSDFKYEADRQEDGELLDLIFGVASTEPAEYSDSFVNAEHTAEVVENEFEEETEEYPEEKAEAKDDWMAGYSTSFTSRPGVGTE